MADVTKFEIYKQFQWSRPDAENPALASPISSTDTDLTFTAPPLDENGLIIAEAFLMGIRNNQTGYTETVFVPASAVQGAGNAPDTTNKGLTATGVVRGINLTGLDPETSNDPTLAVDHPQDSPVYGNISAILFEMMQSALNGGIASGGNSWQIGRNQDEDITVFAANGDANKPAWRYNSAQSKWEYSDDGLLQGS